MAEKTDQNKNARLAAALRANLARRKALSRAMGSDDAAAAQSEIKPDPKT